MPTFILVVICSLVLSCVHAQMISDSTFSKNESQFLIPKGGSFNDRSFTSSFSAFEANVFSPVYQSKQRNFRINAGISQSFFLNPAQEAWVGNRPYSPITAAPSYPNFVPVQVSPSIGLHSNKGTFYSFSQGAFQANQFNPLFRGINIVKPLGGRKP